MDQATIITVLAALTSGAAISKFIVHMSIAPIKLQNIEILTTLKEINETLKCFQISQTEKNGAFVTANKCDKHLCDVYGQIDNVRDRISAIEGQLK